MVEKTIEIKSKRKPQNARLITRNYKLDKEKKSSIFYAKANRVYTTQISNIWLEALELNNKTKINVIKKLDLKNREIIIEFGDKTENV